MLRRHILRFSLALALAPLLTGFGGLAAAQEVIKLSTTTSTENSGLLTYLLPQFEASTHTKVHVISVGTGKALELAKNGDVDVTLVHARPSEDKFVADGHGVNRRDVMYNDFIIVGPESDPAGIRGSRDVIGAMKKIVDSIQLKTVLGYIESGQSEGAKLLSGGLQQRTGSGGYFVAPTLFDGVDSTMTIAREEIFGPVLSVIGFTDLDDAIRQANATTYGLHAAIWTADLNKAVQTARALRAGTVHVNSYDEDDITVPFGGVKQSGNGRDKSLHAFDKYTELKTTWIRIG